MIKKVNSLESHFFNVEVASVLDVNCAIIYQNLYYWVQNNMHNNRNFFDGRYWTYNSVDAFRKKMPYLTVNQIRRSLERLEDSGFIVSGVYNKVAYDRTKWYSVELQSDLANLPNGIGCDAKPIPDINTNENTNENTINNQSNVQPSVDTIDIPDFEDLTKLHEKSAQQHSDAESDQQFRFTPNIRDMFDVEMDDKFNIDIRFVSKCVYEINGVYVGATENLFGRLTQYSTRVRSHINKGTQAKGVTKMIAEEYSAGRKVRVRVLSLDPFDEDELIECNRAKVGDLNLNSSKGRTWNEMKAEKKDRMWGFEEFWNTYDKKRERKKCEAKWSKISDKDKKAIFEVLDDHVLITARDGGRFRPFPYTWLNGRRWEDDISQDLIRAGVRRTKTEYKKTELDEW